MGRISHLLRFSGLALAIAFLFPAAVTPLSAQQENTEPAPVPVPPTTPGPVTPRAATVNSPAPASTGKAVNQFSVTCEDPKVRLVFSSFADSIDREFRQLIRDKTAWIYPIGLYVKGSLSDLEEGPTTVNRIDLLPNDQFNLQIGIRLSSAFSQEEAARELIRVLMFERMLRRYQSSPGSVAGKEIDTPPWLIFGVDELMRHRQNGRPSGFYAGIVQSRQVLSAEEILRGDPSKMDALSGAVHKASSAALVAALLDQPQGQQHFRDFLGGLAGVGPDAVEPLLRQHFPGLRGSSGALEKWWSLQVAHMGQKQAFEFLTAGETEALLEEALVVRFGVEPEEDPKGLVGKFLPTARPGQPFEGRIHDYQKFIGRQDARAVLTENRIKLRSLSLQCFPLYRNLVSRYEAIVLLLLDGRKHGIRAELESIDRARDGAVATMRRVDDYMNYYEATRGKGQSGAFENYHQTRKKIEQHRKPDRKDRISKYLDALESEFEEVDSP